VDVVLAIGLTHGPTGLDFKILHNRPLYQFQTLPPPPWLAIFTRKIMAKFKLPGDLDFLFGYAAERF
jgi:hypothetical protein